MREFQKEFTRKPDCQKQVVEENEILNREYEQAKILKEAENQQLFLVFFLVSTFYVFFPLNSLRNRCIEDQNDLYDLRWTRVQEERGSQISRLRMPCKILSELIIKMR